MRRKGRGVCGVDIQLRWHLGPMGEEEVHNPPHRAPLPQARTSFLWERQAWSEPGGLQRQLKKQWFHLSQTHAA